MASNNKDMDYSELYFETGPSKDTDKNYSEMAWATLNLLYKEKNKQKDTIVANYMQQLMSTKDELEDIGKAIAEIQYLVIKQKTKNSGSNALHRIKEKLDLVLQKMDIEIIDPEGEPLDDDWIEKVDIIKTVPNENAKVHCIGISLSPIIIRKGNLISRAGVVAWDVIEK